MNLVDASDSNSGAKILGLLKDSSSASAGARQGDEVLEVDGTSTIGLSAYQTSERIQVYMTYGRLYSLMSNRAIAYQPGFIADRVERN